MKSRLKNEDNVFINESEHKAKRNTHQMHLEQTFEKILSAKIKASVRSLQ